MRYVIYGCVVYLALWVIGMRFAFPIEAGVLAFPYAYIVQGSGTMAYAVLGQYPIYGWFLGQAMRRGRFGRALLWLVGVHAAAVVVALWIGWLVVV